MNLRKNVGRVIEKMMISNLRYSLLMILRRYLRGCDKVGEIGCGGYGSLDYNQIVGNFSLFGYDLREENVKKFSLKYGCPCKVFNLDKDSLKGNFDLVILGGVVQYLDDPDGAIKKIYNVLDRKGILILTSVNKRNWLRRIKIISDVAKPGSGERRLYSSRELEGLIKRNRFKIIERWGSDMVPMPRSVSSNLIYVCSK